MRVFIDNLAEHSFVKLEQTVKIHRCIFLILTSLALGCGDPPLHPVTGKVTLDGKAYERLIVYFRPMDGKPSEFNIGVGETDHTGKLTLRSTAGGGLQKGMYRVSFTCVVPANKSGAATGLSDEKSDDDRRLVTKELVPDEYASQESPVEFEVQSGDNVFEYDIPGA